MSEVPVPYGPKKKQSNMERVAAFMNGFLGKEIFMDISCPAHLQDKDYEDLDEDGKREWYEFTLNEIFRMAAMQVVCVLGRSPSAVELALIKRRIVNFFKQAGIEYEK